MGAEVAERISTRRRQVATEDLNLDDLLISPVFRTAWSAARENGDEKVERIVFRLLYFLLCPINFLAKRRSPKVANMVRLCDCAGLDFDSYSWSLWNIQTTKKTARFSSRSLNEDSFQSGFLRSFLQPALQQFLQVGHSAFSLSEVSQFQLFDGRLQFGSLLGVELG